MKFFSRITFICNLCFVAYVIFRFIENRKVHAGTNDAVIPVPWLEGTLVVLGVCSLLVSFLFVLVFLILRAIKKLPELPGWIVLANVGFLVAEIIYFLA